MAHKSVLVEEVVSLLAVNPGDVVVDGTLGGGGHSETLCKRNPGITLIGFDLDQDALSRTEARLAKSECKFHLVEANFKDMVKELAKLGIQTVDRVLLDIGLSSDQFEVSGRGFSFQRDEPLLMTFRKSLSKDDLTALQIINEWPEEEIANALFKYGEERYGRRIAKAIVERRRDNLIRRTSDLVSIIQESVPASYSHGRLHPATKTFQAIRIVVNQELENLETVIPEALSLLRSGGRLAIISFHSLEDRIVKNLFKDFSAKGLAKLITKKPITPSQDEIIQNPRARSAKLRVIEKN